MMHPRALRTVSGKRGAVPALTMVIAALAAALLFAGCQSPPPPAPPTVPPTAPAGARAPAIPTAPAVPTPDYWPTVDWKTSTPERQGMDSAKLAAMFDAIAAKQLNLHSVLIIRNGYIVAEAYFPPYGPDVRQQVMSVTKTVSGMLTGIAMAEGKIQGTGETVLSFFPDRKPANLDDNKRKMTLADLLTLTTGLACLDEKGDLDRMFPSPDWVQYTLDLPMADAPGTTFRYCSPAANLFSPILKQATGVDERQFANRVLFAPLGIAPAGPMDWDADPQGNSEAFAGLHLAPRDMAKLGLLYLQGGSWDGREVVPASWVAASLSPHTVEAKSGRPYGYLTWLYPQGYRSAMGLGGQDIHIIPAKNMVVVFTAAMDIPTHDREVIKLLDEYVVPAASPTMALPENAEAQAGLQARIAALAGQKLAVPPLPPIAAQISGKTYNLEPNPNGWKTIVLSYTEGSPEAELIVDGLAHIRVGLDNVYRTSPGPAGALAALRGGWEAGGVFSFDADVLGSFQHWRYRVMPGKDLLIEGTETVTGLTYTMRGHPAP